MLDAFAHAVGQRRLSAEVLDCGRPPRWSHVTWRAYLSVLGAEVRVAFSGEEAIEIAQSFQPRLVVLDINMPGLDGFETAEALRLQAWAHDATFVAHTAASPALRHAAAAAGFHHFLVKGNSVADFEAIVDGLLKSGARRR